MQAITLSDIDIERTAKSIAQQDISKRIVTPYGAKSLRNIYLREASFMLNPSTNLKLKQKK